MKKDESWMQRPPSLISLLSWSPLLKVLWMKWHIEERESCEGLYMRYDTWFQSIYKSIRLKGGTLISYSVPIMLGFDPLWVLQVAYTYPECCCVHWECSTFMVTARPSVTMTMDMNIIFGDRDNQDLVFGDIQAPTGFSFWIYDFGQMDCLRVQVRDFTGDK